MKHNPTCPACCDRVERKLRKLKRRDREMSFGMFYLGILLATIVMSFVAGGLMVVVAKEAKEARQEATR